MSLKALFYPGALRLKREKWGVTFPNAKAVNADTGQLQFEDIDTGVNKLAEEIYAILSTTRITLNEPVVFERGEGYTGPLFQFIDNGVGPTIRIEGDNLQTDISLGDLVHTTNVTNNTDYNDGDQYELVNVRGPITYGDEGDIILGGDTVIINTGGGGGEGGGPGNEEQKTSFPGKIVSGSGDTYTVDLYANSPFEAKTETVTATALGAGDSWKLLAGTWVDVKQAGDDYWFIPQQVSIVRQFEIFSEGDDRLIGFDQDGATTFIAKPYLLQRTRWDNNATRNGISYSYTSPNERGALQGGTAESQRILPRYYTGTDPGPDTIYAAYVIDGTGLIDDNGEPIHWIDINADGRYWAKISGT